MLSTERRLPGESTRSVSVKPPILIQTRGRRFAVAYLLYAIAYLGAFGYFAPMGPTSTRWGFWAQVGGPILATYLVLTVLYGLWALKERAWKRRAALMRYVLCCRCGYSLRGLTEQRECPECGWHFHSLDEVKAAWRDWEPKRAPWWFRAVTALIRRLRRRT